TFFLALRLVAFFLVAFFLVAFRLVALRFTAFFFVALRLGAAFFFFLVAMVIVDLNSGFDTSAQESKRAA
ncbi:MAG: hypothetical protein MK213_00550, partial [Planctomycetes bacterium]|nr:hypothetical protein [Planctomycetota bacterium]